ncbi:MAG: hypothetical protein JO073_11155 [Actinobacteria bacterium]|nr:hypothetical protein [Actinomycetota bacterium]
MSYRLGITTVLAAVAALLASVAPASASHTARFGVQDDAWLMYGPGTLDQRVATLQDLGVGVVRLTIDWNAVAPTRPASPRDPSDPAYRWGAYADALNALHAAGIPAIVTLWGSPRWANLGHPANWLPASGFGDFAYAAATEFPWVRQWTAWNEPNSRTFSVPVSPRLYVQRVLNPAYAALHQASSANEVAGGVTSPRQSPSGMAPLSFMAGMHAAHARLDAYAQNPYPASPKETPNTDPCRYCTTLSMAHLAQIRADVTRYFGSKPIWLTEYGYQTNPPDRLLGVSPAKQAAYEAEAALKVWQQAGVTVLIHFLVKDEPELGGWQSGFLTSRGSQKLSYAGFGLPLAEVSRRGTTTVVWGQVRPGHGGRKYVLQRWTGHGWAAVGGTRTTDSTGSFTRTISASPGQRLRVTSPEATYASPALTIS